MAATARQKRSYLHQQGEFQLQNCTVGTVHDSDHEGLVRIFVGHSYHSNELFILHYAALYFLYQECNIIHVAELASLAQLLPPCSPKVTEGVSGQSFDSGHALHAPRIRSVSSSSELW